jgi:hypothetical protein
MLTRCELGADTVSRKVRYLPGLLRLYRMRSSSTTHSRSGVNSAPAHKYRRSMARVGAALKVRTASMTCIEAPGASRARLLLRVVLTAGPRGGGLGCGGLDDVGHREEVFGSRARRRAGASARVKIRSAVEGRASSVRQLGALDLSALDVICDGTGARATSKGRSVNNGRPKKRKTTRSV